MLSLIVLRGMRTVQLTKGCVALIDESDWPEVSQIEWGAYIGPRGHRYAVGKFNGAHGGMHRFLLNPLSNQDVDHRSGDGLDNTRSNLRVCTRAENIRNCRKTYGRSRFKGVNFHKGHNQWRARIMAPDGKRRELGNFSTERDAALAYDRAAVELFGQFACTNAHIFRDVEPNAAVASIENVAEGLACLAKYGPGRVQVATNMVLAGPDASDTGYLDADVATLERNGWSFNVTECLWRRPV